MAALQAITRGLEAELAGLRAAARARMLSGLDEAHDTLNALLWNARDAFAAGRSDAGAHSFAVFGAALRLRLEAERQLLHELEQLESGDGRTPMLPLWIEHGQLRLLLDLSTELVEDGADVADALADLGDLLEAHRLTAEILLGRRIDTAGDPVLLGTLAGLLHSTVPVWTARHAA